MAIEKYYKTVISAKSPYPEDPILNPFLHLPKDKPVKPSQLHRRSPEPNAIGHIFIIIDDNLGLTFGLVELENS